MQPHKQPRYGTSNRLSTVARLPIEGINLRGMPPPLPRVVPPPDALKNQSGTIVASRQATSDATPQPAPRQICEVRGLPLSTLSRQTTARKRRVLPQEVPWTNSVRRSQASDDFYHKAAVLEAQWNVVYRFWHFTSLRQRRIYSRYVKLPDYIKNQMADAVQSGMDMIDTHATQLQAFRRSIGTIEQAHISDALEESYQKLKIAMPIYTSQELALDHLEQEVEADPDAASEKYRVDRVLESGSEQPELQS